MQYDINKPIITLDLDWCSDDVLDYTLNLIGENNLQCIIFVTHLTQHLDRIRRNKNIQLGIHPNFNCLLEGDFQYGKTIKEVFSYYMNLLPEATVFRSHSLTQNSHIVACAIENGLVGCFNDFIPLSADIILKPYSYMNKIIKYPHFFEDDLHFTYEGTWEVEKYLQHAGLKIFDFHPIHLFLNTDCVNTYLQAKSSQHEFAKLKNLVNTKHKGTRDFFLEVIKNAKF